MNGTRAGGWIGVLLGLVVGLSALLFYVAGGDLGVGRGFGRSSIDSERSNAIVRATERVSPAVVSITSFRRESLSFAIPEWLRRFAEQIPQPLGPRQSDAMEAFNVGSGIIVDSRGYILTNNHVVANAEKIAITLRSGEDFEAELVNNSETYDLALLRFSGRVSGLPVAPLGDSDELEIGEWAIAIGSPYGFLLADTSPTVTVGVISALNRDIRPDQRNSANLFDMIQTDASILPGNSGGPLVNSDGEVIGINSYVIGGQDGRTGLGFAVPINRGKWVMEEILTYGRVRATYYGLGGGWVSPQVIQRNRLRPDTPRGYLIASIDPGSPADRAGLQLGDVITQVGGKEIGNNWELTRGLFAARVGTRLEFTVWRAGSLFEVDITPVELPSR